MYDFIMHRVLHGSIVKRFTLNFEVRKKLLTQTEKRERDLETREEEKNL